MSKKKFSEKCMNKSRMHYTRGHYKRSSFWRYLLRVFCACDISAEAQIDESVQLAHNGLGVVIGPDVVIDEGVTIFQNVTIGGNYHKTGSPHIKKGCTIMTGAVIVGPVSIGEGSIIGANLLITRDVPKGTMVVRQENYKCKSLE